MRLIEIAAVGKDKELAEKNDLFSKTKFIIKNTSLNKKGLPKERLSFRNLKVAFRARGLRKSSFSSIFLSGKILR